MLLAQLSRHRGGPVPPCPPPCLVFFSFAAPPAAPPAAPRTGTVSVPHACSAHDCHCFPQYIYVYVYVYVCPCFHTCIYISYTEWTKERRFHFSKDPNFYRRRSSSSPGEYTTLYMHVYVYVYVYVYLYSRICIYI